MASVSLKSLAATGVEHIALKAAVRDLVDDVKARHPDEDLRCQYLRTLDEMTRAPEVDEKSTWFSRIKPWLVRVERGNRSRNAYFFFGNRHFLLHGDTFKLGFGWNPEVKTIGVKGFGLELYFARWNYCFYEIY